MSFVITSASTAIRVFSLLFVLVRKDRRRLQVMPRTDLGQSSLEVLRLALSVHRQAPIAPGRPLSGLRECAALWIHQDLDWLTMSK